MNLINCRGIMDKSMTIKWRILFALQEGGTKSPKRGEGHGVSFREVAIGYKKDISVFWQALRDLIDLKLVFLYDPDHGYITELGMDVIRQTTSLAGEYTSEKEIVMAFEKIIQRMKD